MAEGDKPSFEERLAAARSKRGLQDPASKPSGKPGGGDDPVGAMSPWALGLRAGADLVAALAVAVAIGWALDRWLHTRPWLMILFIPLGGAAGIRSIWRLYVPRG